MTLHLSTPRSRDIVTREAIFDSEARKYRDWLMREWDAREPVLTICGVNPSKADHVTDDPTVAKLIRWVKVLGYGSFVLVNLFGLVSPEPRDLERAVDPVGADNDHYLWHAAESSKQDGGRFVTAWGRNGLYKHRGRVVMAELAKRGVSTWCFAINGDGTPKHPARAAYTSKLLPYYASTAA